MEPKAVRFLDAEFIMALWAAGRLDWHWVESITLSDQWKDAF